MENHVTDYKKVFINNHQIYYMIWNFNSAFSNAVPNYKYVLFSTYITQFNKHF